MSVSIFPAFFIARSRCLPDSSLSSLRGMLFSGATMSDRGVRNSWDTVVKKSNLARSISSIFFFSMFAIFTSFFSFSLIEKNDQMAIPPIHVSMV